MNRKVKELKRKAQAPDDGDDPDRDYTRTADRWKKEQSKPRSSFKAKRKTNYSPRVRHIEDDVPEDEGTMDAGREKVEPFIPEYVDGAGNGDAAPKRPFLRLVKG